MWGRKNENKCTNVIQLRLRINSYPVLEQKHVDFNKLPIFSLYLLIKR